MQGCWFTPATTVTTLVPIFPLSALHRAFVEPFAVPAVERSPTARRNTDRRVREDRRQMRAEWPARLNRRGMNRRAEDRQRRDRAASTALAVKALPPRKGLIVDIYV